MFVHVDYVVKPVAVFLSLLNNEVIEVGDLNFSILRQSFGERCLPYTMSFFSIDTSQLML